MPGIISSGLIFCETNNYRTSDMAYEKFKDKMRSWDRESYEKWKLKTQTQLK